jgi:hypothetical protein
MTDLARLLPPSISEDPAMQTAAQAAGSQEETVRGLIPNAYIWSRLDELPEDIIDHLAWGLHIDGYEYATTLKQKRWLVANFHDLHRYKGTVYGLRLYWRVLLGRELLAASPPHKSYLGHSLTPAERAAFEAPHPEVRIYPFRHAGTKRGLMLGDCLGWPPWPVTTDAILRIGDRVEIFDPQTNTATPIHTLERTREETTKVAVETVRIRRPGQAAGVFAGVCLAGSTVDHKAKSRLFTLQLERPYQSELERRSTLTITPGLAAMSAYYTIQGDPGQARGAFLANRWPEGGYSDRGGRAWPGALFTIKSTAGDRLYKRFKLFDPARVVVNQRHASTFLGAFRLGSLPPHQAEVTVDAAGQRPPRSLHLGGAYLAQHHPYQSDAPTRVAQIRHVGCLAKRASDKVSLSITNRKPITASTSVLAGAVKAGQYQLEAY